MNKIRLSSFAFFCGFGLAVAACATSATDDVPVPTDSGPNVDAGKLDAKAKTDSSTPVDSSAQCPSQCTSDQDCQSACPNPSQGLNCCDTQTGVCYVESSSTCPSPPDSSVGGG